MVISTKKKKKEAPIENLKKGLARSGKIVLDALGPLGQTSDLHTNQYPCYVIALSKLLKMDKLESHDDLLDKGMLEELTWTSMQKAPPWVVPRLATLATLEGERWLWQACSPYL